MKLATMRYKNYVWPHNPRVYEGSMQRSLCVHSVPFGGFAVQDMGRQPRVFEGEGEFCGAGAYDQFRALEQLFLSGGAGLLTHPLWGSVTAEFALLEKREEPTADYVAYRFRFVESGAGAELAALRRVTAASGSASGTGSAAQSAAAGGALYYTAVWGDYLYKIARENGLTLKELLALNPQIKNPNILMVGDRVRVR